MGTIVWRATLGDIDQVVPLFDEYRQFYRQPSEPDRVVAFMFDRLRNQDSVIFLGRAEPAGPAMGFTQLYPVFSSVSIGRAFILNDLFVAPAGRGHGLGAALLERAAAFGREVGARYLELETAVTNVTAQRLYEKLGWKRETAFHRYGLDLASS